MNRIYLLVLTLICLNGCKNTAVKPMAIEGEWRYVGTFDHRANYICYICPDFDFDKSIYHINLETNASFTGTVNLLRVDGNFQSKTISVTETRTDGVFSIQNYRLLNKPPETEADSKFQNLFKTVTYFSLSDNNSTSFDELTLGNDSNEFLFFVRKK